MFADVGVVQVTEPLSKESRRPAVQKGQCLGDEVRMSGHIIWRFMCRAFGATSVSEAKTTDWSGDCKFVDDMATTRNVHGCPDGLVEGRWWERRDTTATTDGQPHMRPVTSRIRFALASIVIIIYHYPDFILLSPF